ncbi:MAG: FprA family A-type flavoprotein [Candidatus Tritonobacter lacicola]|nr:FprA family A-type flavoprotein [Candidatus Tritonobacter lacicola]
MEPVEVKQGIYWVGGIDWDLRNFHGYITQRGSTYNAYLIVDEKIVLVDTVKHYLFDEMLARIRKVVDPSKIDYIVANHVEMDHSGCLVGMAEIAEKAVVLTSPKGEEGLRRHFKKDLNFRIVQNGETVNIGKRDLQFFHMPMVHWPDSMATYCPQEKLLLPNDAFGQHIATAERFDDEVPFDILREEAAKYYANIVLPYGSQVQKVLHALSSLEIDMIGPSHGIIWRSHIPDILAAYEKWANNDTDKKALIVYDTMWGSTRKMAYALKDGLEECGIPVTMRNLELTHISDIMADVLESRAILIGSPTLNKGMMPTIGALLTYLTGLCPKKRTGMAFGSYGWAEKSVGEIEEAMKAMKWDVPIDGPRIRYVPDPEELEEVRETGKQLGAIINK